MGHLPPLDIGRFAELYKTKHYVETGAGHGTSLLYATQFPFKSLWSCDIEPSLMAHATGIVKKHADRATVVLGESTDYLKLVLTELPKDEPILFWLDAHFPGADVGLKPWEHEQDEDSRLPMKGELELIRDLRPAGKDVIFVDDLRIWLDDMPVLGAGNNLPPFLMKICPKERNIDFVYAAMGATHEIELLYMDQGYIRMTPK